MKKILAAIVLFALAGCSDQKQKTVTIDNLEQASLDVVSCPAPSWGGTVSSLSQFARARKLAAWLSPIQITCASAITGLL